MLEFLRHLFSFESCSLSVTNRKCVYLFKRLKIKGRSLVFYLVTGVIVFS